MVLGNEFFNRLTKRFGHRHRLDKIGAGFRKSFAFRRIGGDGREGVGPGSFRGAQHDPDARRTGRKVLTITRRLGAIEIDRSTARIIKGRPVLLAQNRPRFHFGLIGQRGNPAPDEIDPG